MNTVHWSKGEKTTVAVEITTHEGTTPEEMKRIKKAVNKLFKEVDAIEPEEAQTGSAL